MQTKGSEYITKYFPRNIFNYTLKRKTISVNWNCTELIFFLIGVLALVKGKNGESNKPLMLKHWQKEVFIERMENNESEDKDVLQ